jgi:hypothetical protein
MRLVLLAERVKQLFRPIEKKKNEINLDEAEIKPTPTGTFVEKFGPTQLKKILGGMKYEIRCWRSVSVRFMRALIHPLLFGRLLLTIFYWLENTFPTFFGENGQYPMVVMKKSR